MRKIGPGVFRFRLFTAAECKSLLALIDEQRATLGGSPNSMNHYGTNLGSRFKPMLSRLVADHVQPLAPAWMILRKHPIAFVVDYSIKTQRSLSKHFDSGSDFTLNVCLGHRFTGGALVVYPDDQISIEIEQKPGFAIVHSGSLIHRATPLTNGTRTNLVLWCGAKKTRGEPVS